MPRKFEYINKTNVIITVILIAITTLIFFYFAVGFSSFNKTTANEIHDDILQGLSGLGSVAIAVIIFRIQSLENRNHSLEQSTLNYISQTMGWSYPEWTASLEEDIKNKTITNRYYADQHLKNEPLVASERDRQQKRLEEALDLHARISQTIRRIRNDVFSCAFFLILPLLLSLLLLMISDFLNKFWTFASVSAVVIMGSLGIMLLIKMVLGSTVK